jgi:hypothetical protein
MPSPKLNKLYPPSAPCSCEVCRTYCIRPGWWSVEEANRAIELGYADRIMLEVSPELTFGVLSPAFKGCEMNFALQEFSANGCTFLVNDLCELFNSGVQPLECRFCHHDRIGLGKKCHYTLEKDWDTFRGQKIVKKWIDKINFKWTEYYYNNILKRSDLYLNK